MNAPAAEVSYLAAFLLGLLGSVHCVGMCGGIVSAFTLGLDPRIRRRPLLGLLPWLSAYNLGRVASYALIGALVGYSGGQLVALGWFAPFPLGHLLTAVCMILIGLYLTGWWRGLLALERAGGALWRRWLQPLARRIGPVRTPARALALGALWGWLPCGLVYSALALAASRAEAAGSALVMLSFGAGTLPAMLAAGSLVRHLQALARWPLARGIAGVAALGFGVYALYRLSLAIALSPPAAQAGAAAGLGPG